MTFLRSIHAGRGTLATATLFGAVLAVLLLPGQARVQTTGDSVSADSILATARDLTGETAVGPPSRIGRRPSTDLYVDYLVQRLAAIVGPFGGTAERVDFQPAFTDSPPDPVRNTYGNVVGFLPGVRSAETNGAFVVGAHLDATGQRTALMDPLWDPMTDPAPGADDNASGIGAVLEGLRAALADGYRPQADLWIMFFDGEEQQYVWSDAESSYVPSSMTLLGSRIEARNFTAVQEAGGKTVFGFVNADMLAFNESRDSLVVVTNIPSRWLANQVVEAGERVPDLLVTRLVQGLTFSDHGPFWEEGYDAVLMIEAADIVTHAAGHYHRVEDTVDNVYSRGGSQAAAAARVYYELLAGWSADSTAVLSLSEEDLLVQDAISVDLSRVRVGQTLDVAVGVTAVGGTAAPDWAVDVYLENLEGGFIRQVGSASGATVLPPGGHTRVRIPWQVETGERGAVQLVAVVRDPQGSVLDTAERTLSVAGDPADIQRAFVYPNPTRDPGSAVVRYELSRGGSMRLSVVGADARTIATADIPYDPVFPGPGTDIGLGEVPLATVLGGRSLAPGLYFLRLELFEGGTESANVALTKFAVLR